MMLNVLLLYEYITSVSQATHLKLYEDAVPFTLPLGATA